jgi:PAS domain S-box-containing protein
MHSVRPQVRFIGAFLAESRVGSRALAIGAAYVVGGILSIVTGLITSGPSGQTAVVWLPPGIALAALLVWGQAHWPGVWLGALVIDTLMAMHEAPSANTGTHVALAVSISIASALQAVVSCGLVRRWADPTLALDRARSVLRFLLCSAFASLISSSIGSLVLVGLGLRKAEDLAFDWSSWWISDTVSVFLVTPVLFSWIGAPVAIWRPRRWQLTIPLCVALTCVATAFVQANRLENERSRRDFERRTTELESAITRELGVVTEAAYVLRDLEEVASPIRATEFHVFASRLLSRSPSISGLAWVPRVAAEQREEHESASRLAGSADYRIRELDAAAQPVPAGARADYFPIQFAEPAADRITLIGFDEASLADRRKLLELGDHNRTLSMSEPIDFAGFASDRRGVLIVLPVFRSANASHAAAFVLSVLRIAPLMRRVSRLGGAVGLHLSLRDERAPPAQQLLFANTEAAASADRIPYRAQRTFALGGRVWNLDVLPTPAHLGAHRSWLSAAVSVIGLMLSALLCGFLLVTSGRSANTQQLVTERTRELSHANAELLAEIETHRRTELALTESEARWQFALEEASEGVWEWRVSEHYLFWSPRLMQVLGYAPGELANTIDKWRSCIHPDDLPAAQAQLNRHLRGETQAFVHEGRLRRKDGSWIWLLTHAKVVARDAKGRPLRVIGTQTDIGERKHWEEELKAHRERLEVLVHERTAELEIAKATAERANHAKSEFLANMSHELRTPMHAILAYARLGLDKALEPKSSEYMQRIHDSGERLLKLLNDLLDLSKLESNATRIDFAPCDLERIAAEVAREIEPLIRGKQLALAIERASDCESCVAHVDRNRIAQMFHNILANAVRFSANGGVLSVRFALAQLPVQGAGSESAARPALEVTFRDEGVGIPEAELEQIFDKFVQSSKTRTNAGGTGLGLAICKEIAELHDGTISARNNPTRGAAFVVTIPFRTPLANAGQAA